jgi:hypothetical protein
MVIPAARSGRLTRTPVDWGPVTSLLAIEICRISAPEV